MQLNHKFRRHNGIRQASVYSWAHGGIHRRSADGTVQFIAETFSLQTKLDWRLLAPAFCHVNPVTGVDKEPAGFFGQGVG